MRKTNMQKLQTELKIQWRFASQATPSPKAKATMETLDRTRTDLSYHYDSVVQSLKKLKEKTDSNDRNGNNYTNNDDFKESDAKPVDKKVQIDNLNADKKGKKTKYFCLSFHLICKIKFYLKYGFLFV